MQHLWHAVLLKVVGGQVDSRQCRTGFESGKYTNHARPLLFLLVFFGETSTTKEINKVATVLVAPTGPIACLFSVTKGQLGDMVPHGSPG